MPKKGFVFIFILIISVAKAQDIEQVIHNKPLNFSGGLNASGTFYHSNAESFSRDPFFWTINGNFNLSVYGVVDVPISFILSKNNSSLGTNQEMFRQFGISPKYRSVTLHLGYRNMNFSPYTMSGITFLGAGVDYNPQNSWLQLRAFYGRFASAKQYKTVSAYDPNAIQDQPVFERWGYGTMITAGKKNHSVDLILFKANDNKQSITVPDSLGIKPIENFIIGVSTKNRITENLHFNLDYSLSAYTTDTRQPEIEQETYTYANNLGFLFTPRSSSQFNHSIQSALEYTFNFASLGVSYKRVDPQYQSLGISFINNDIREFAANIATSLFKNKLSLAGNFGSQVNNLDNSQLTTNKRFITSLNCTYMVNKNLNFTGSYANFNSNATPTQIQLVDSIKYTQSNSNFTFTSNYNFGAENRPQGVNFLTTYQQGNTLNQAGTNVTDITNSFWNSYLMYRLTFSPYLLSFTLSFNYSTFETQSVNTTSTGPTLGINKGFLDNKMSVSLNSSYLNTSSSTENSSLINIRFFTNYKINNHHTFKLGITYLNKSSDIKSVNQFQGNIAYNYFL